MTDPRPVYRRVGIGMLLGRMIEDKAFPTDWPEEMVVTTARDLFHDRKVVDGVRGTLERFGAVEPGATGEELVRMLEILLAN